MSMENESNPLPAVFSEILHLLSGEQVTLEEWMRRTPPSQFYTVRKVAKSWQVLLVTESGGAIVNSALYSFSDRDAAIVQAKETAARQGLPFKMRGTA
jgi:hypothetical protein